MQLCNSFAFEFVVRDFTLQSQLISDNKSQKAKDLHSPVNDKYGKAHLDKFMQILKLSMNTGPLRYEKEGGRRQRAKGSVAEQSSRWERERE